MCWHTLPAHPQHNHTSLCQGNTFPATFINAQQLQPHSLSAILCQVCTWCNQTGQLHHFLRKLWAAFFQLSGQVFWYLSESNNKQLSYQLVKSKIFCNINGPSLVPYLHQQRIQKLRKRSSSFPFILAESQWHNCVCASLVSGKGAGAIQTLISGNQLIYPPSRNYSTLLIAAFIC